jgi:hypothetical protein
VLAKGPLAKSTTTTVELENSTWVVERGVRHTEWFVKLADSWARVADVAGVETSLGSSDDVTVTDDFGDVHLPPGCQYICRFRVVLPLGTPLRRRVSRPRSARRAAPSGSDAVGADLKRDILGYFRYAKPPLAVTETHFLVARRGLVLDRRTVRGSDSTESIRAR